MAVFDALQDAESHARALSRFDGHPYTVFLRKDAQGPFYQVEPEKPGSTSRPMQTWIDGERKNP
jgi:hypothetical protein